MITILYRRGTEELTMETTLWTLIYLTVFVALSKSTESQTTTASETELTEASNGQTTVGALTSTVTKEPLLTTTEPLPPITEPLPPTMKPMITTTLVVSTSHANPSPKAEIGPSITTTTIAITTTKKPIKLVESVNEDQKEADKNDTSKADVIPPQIYTREPEVSSSTSSTTESKQTIAPTYKTTPSTTEDVDVTSNQITYNNRSSSTIVDNVTAETEAPNDIDNSAIYLKFSGNCVNDKHSSQEMDFVQFQDTDTACQLTLKLVAVENQQEVFRQLKQLVGKLRIYHDDVAMQLIGMESNFEYLVNNDTGTENNWRFIKGLSYNEFVAYIVIGCSFGVLLLTALCLLCIKCCRCGKKNELRDIPHLTLKLEDYALTRIPRPNTMYSESSKIPIISDDTSTASVQGHARSTEGHDDGARISRAYDTGVVPMEEYEYDGNAHYATPGFHNGAQNGKEMRTFRVKTESPTKHKQMEERVSYNNDSIATNSTEKLARDFYRRQGTGYGEENPIYKT